jgi:hypothetical protein
MSRLSTVAKRSNAEISDAITPMWVASEQETIHADEDDLDPLAVNTA